MSTTEMDTVTAAEVEPWDTDEFYEAKSEWSRGHQAYRELLQKFPLHPCVEMMIIDCHRPKDVHQLALEWPHVSTTDDTRIGYTRNASDLLSERKLVTSVGKFLARHWPHVPDHTRRDVQATFVPDRREIVRTTPEMIAAVENGPRSCMGSVHATIQFTRVHRDIMNRWFADPANNLEPNWALHPYSAYRPDLGWSMAVRHARQPDKSWRIDGRALILSRPDEKPVFVRTYKRNINDPVTGWSETDFALQGWLTRSGYEKRDGWPEGALMYTPFLREGGTELRAPYIDGLCRQLTLAPEAGENLARFDYEALKVGSYQCETTSGFVSATVPKLSRQARRNQSIEDFAAENEYDEDECSSCEDCDAPYHNDDGQSVGRDEDHRVCESCRDNNYTWVRGSSRWNGYREYYVNEDDAQTMNNGDYAVDTNNLPDSVVCTEGGDYAERDDCVYVDNVGYFFDDDEDVVCDADGNYQMREDCVFLDDIQEYSLSTDAYQSESDSDKWFSTGEARDEFDGIDDDEPIESVEAAKIPDEEETEVIT